MTSISLADEQSFADKQGLTHALRATFLALLVSALAISAMTLFLRWRHTPQLAFMVAASCLVALMLSHSGRMRSALLLVLLGITYAVMHAAARNSGIENIGLAILPVLIVVSGLLLDRLIIVVFTATAIFATSGMLAIRYFVLRAERFSTNDMGDLFIFTLTCATAALVGRLFAQRIKKDFRQVRESESRYRRIFESVQDVYYEMRTDGTLLELSPACAALFGVPREEMIGCPLAPFCVNRSEFDALLAALRTHGRVSNREVVIRDSGAELRYVLVNASLRSESGEERVIGSVREITDRKRVEDPLRESEARLRLALDATGAGTFDFYPHRVSQRRSRGWQRAVDRRSGPHAVRPGKPGHPVDRYHAGHQRA
jgi:PAS domain S-box-containing protein